MTLTSLLFPTDPLGFISLLQRKLTHLTLEQRQEIAETLPGGKVALQVDATVNVEPPND